MSMWFDGFFSPRPTPYTISVSNTTKNCTAWDGHAFQKFDAETIFCPTCGQSKTVKP